MMFPARLADMPFLAERLQQQALRDTDSSAFEYAGLIGCRVLCNTGNSILVLGTNVEGQRCVAKFQSLIISSAGDSGEASVVSTAAYLNAAIALPVFDVIPFAANPIDSEDYGWVYTMPYCEGGSLKDQMNFGFGGTGEKLVSLAIVAICIAGMHKNGVIHADIKPSNLLYWLNPQVLLSSDDVAEPEFQLVISDYGEASESGSIDRRRIRKGTIPYCAPESATSARPDMAEDVWAWATIGLEVFLSPHHFEMVRLGASEYEILSWISQTDCPPFLATLILAARSRNSENRPTSYQVAEALFENVLRQHVEDQVDVPVQAGPHMITCVNRALFSALASLGIVGLDVRLWVGLTDALQTCANLLATQLPIASAAALRLLRLRMGVGEDSLPEQLIRWPNNEMFHHMTPPGGVIVAPLPREQVVAGTWLYLRVLLVCVQCTARADDIDELSRLAISLRSPNFPTPLDHLTLIASALVVIGSPRVAIQTLESNWDEHSHVFAAVISAAYLAIGEHELALKFKVVATQKTPEQENVGKLVAVSELMILTCLLDGSVPNARDLLLAFLSTYSEELQALTGQSAIIALASWYLSDAVDLPEDLVTLLFSPTLISVDTSVQKIWLLIACLDRSRNGVRAQKMALATLKNPRTRLPMQALFRAALENFAYNNSTKAPPLSLDLAPDIVLARARTAESNDHHEEALQSYRLLLAAAHLPMSYRILCSFEIAGILDRLGRNQEELKVYETFFEDTFPQDWDGEEKGVIKLAVNELITHKQNRSFACLVKRYSVFDRLLSTSAKVSNPEPYCQLLWHTAYALHELGRYNESNTLCDEIHSIFLESSSEELRGLARNVLLYKGSTLCEIDRTEEEHLVYLEYTNRFGSPANAEEALQLMRVWYYIAVFLARSDRLKALDAFVSFDQVFRQCPLVPDEELGELLLQTDPLREGLLNGGAVPDHCRYMVQEEPATSAEPQSPDDSPASAIKHEGSSLWERVTGWLTRR